MFRILDSQSSPEEIRDKPGQDEACKMESLDETPSYDACSCSFLSRRSRRGRGPAARFSQRSTPEPDRVSPAPR